MTTRYVCLCVRACVCTCVYVSVCLSVCLSVDLSVCLSVPCEDLYLGDCVTDYGGRCSEPLIHQLCAKTCGLCQSSTHSSFCTLLYPKEDFTLGKKTAHFPLSSCPIATIHTLSMARSTHACKDGSLKNAVINVDNVLQACLQYASPMPT